jgi:hypothetical protein
MGTVLCRLAKEIKVEQIARYGGQESSQVLDQELQLPLRTGVLMPVDKLNVEMFEDCEHKHAGNEGACRASSGDNAEFVRYSIFGAKEIARESNKDLEERQGSGRICHCPRVLSQYQKGI